MKQLLKLKFVVILLTLFTTQAYAKSEIYTSAFSNIAVGGYDTVAYFTQNGPVKGSEEFSTSWKGAEWHFSSAENLEKFKANPNQYAPQYGGYCAYAVANGGTAKGDPQFWKIVDGKLYLNFNKKIQGKWLQNTSQFITDADANWPDVLN